MSKRVHLTVGSLEGEGALNQEKGYLDKPVMLVYAGKFESMDGPVEIKDEDIDTLVSNHNSFLSKLSRLATGEVPLKHAPPIQLDHSTSARDTVGRLVGDLKIGEHTLEDGSKVKAMLGTARILGQDNIERVQDGRWAHVSMGADLETHKLTELTITPFPAAAEASLLSKASLAKYKGYEYKIVPKKGRYYAVIEEDIELGPFNTAQAAGDQARENIDNHIRETKDFQGGGDGAKVKMSRTFNYKGCKIEIVRQDEDGVTYIVSGPGISGQEYTEDISGAAAISKGKKIIDGWDQDDLLKRLSTSNNKTEVRMGYKDLKEKMAAYEKCRKHLTEHKGMSEEDAEKKLEAATDDDLTSMSKEHDDQLSRMADEEAKKKEEEEKRMAGLSATREGFLKLSKGLKSTAQTVKLAAKKSAISVRLARLQAETKVTPAEIKALNIDEFAKKDEKVIEEVLSSYEKREPVIDVGLHGSTKASTPAQLASHLKKLNLTREELDARLNMPMKRDEALKQLTKLAEGGEKEVTVHIDNVPQGEHSDQEFEQLWGDVKASLTGGKEDEAKERLKSYCSGLGQKMSGAEPVGSSTAEMTALAEEVKKMQTDFDEIVKLAAPALGIKTEELS